jgi:dihydrodipicolinate synthase/N-acetylneuraminate lyase
MKELGLLVPIATPLTKSGEIDEKGLTSLCHYVVDAGCHGIFACGSTGRGPWLGRNARAEVCAIVAGAVKSSIPVFAGCMASGLSDMVENAHLMAEAGAQFAVVTAPGYFHYNQSEVERILLRFADVSPLPVVIYDIPPFAGMKLDTEMVRRVAHHPRVVGFKDSTADLERFLQLLESMNNRDDFYMLQGKENLLGESLLAGASGFVVSLVQIDPHPFVALYSAARAGKKDSVEAAQKVVTEMLDLLTVSVARRPETSTFFHFLNQALRAHAVCDNILLEHEGECPTWLAENARKAMAVAESGSAEARTHP